MALEKKDEFFDWLIPNQYSKKVIKGDCRYNSGKREVFYVSKEFLKKNNIPFDDLRLAFTTRKEIHLVFNPPKGVPFVRMSTKGDKASPWTINKQVVQMIVNRFKIGKNTIIEFDLVNPTELDGMVFWQLVPQTPEANR